MKRLKQTAVWSLVTTGLVTILVAIALVAVPSLRGTIVNAIDDSSAPVIEASQILLEQGRVNNLVYDTVAPSVVSLNIQARQDDDSPYISISSGSGFVVDEDGHIVTNHHVVEPALQAEQILGEGAESRIEVSMFDGTITSADIIGTDPDSDIAVIRVDVPQDRLNPVTFGDSDALEEGQIVFALGNPFANDWTLTSGIVSALNRSIPGLELFSTGGVIQTDAAINPGNSGGPLVDITGRVIGVNSQINSETRSNSGIGFAVPSNLVLRVANSLIETGDVAYAYVGITSGSMNLTLIEAYDLPNNLRGVPIDRVLPGTPADIAGFEGISRSSIDIIVAVDGLPIANFSEMIGYLGINTEPGDTVIFTVYRDGEILDLPTVLAPRPEQ
ncbi:MAG: trypsin-like peptidase domain-containing protein [Chloroflexota bacterium]